MLRKGLELFGATVSFGRCGGNLGIETCDSLVYFGQTCINIVESSLCLLKVSLPKHAGNVDNRFIVICRIGALEGKVFTSRIPLSLKFALFLICLFQFFLRGLQLDLLFKLNEIILNCVGVIVHQLPLF